MYDLLVNNARLYPMAVDTAPARESSLGIRDGKIAAMGIEGDARRTYDACGRIVMPAFVDCHTHALYAGNRMKEHMMKLAGATYEEIAKSGGGILSTVSAVHEASEDELVSQTLPRVRALLREGVATIEIKSGYGLSLEHELKMLRAIAKLKTLSPQNIVTTFLGAHAVPQHMSKTEYLDALVEEMLPVIAEEGLAESVDIFVESIAFDTSDLKRYFDRARQLGLKLRAHTEQLSNLGGTELAAREGALSCDHLEHADRDAVEAMAKSGTVAVLLPGAYYFLRETKLPPIALFRELGVPMAIATDLNPGSSPVVSLLTVMHMAAQLFGLTPDEVLLGVSRHAAEALGHANRYGTLRVGGQADFCVWDVPAPDFLLYQLGGVKPDAVFIRGVAVENAN